jgi:uncharacterized protein (TIGR03067 family)
MLRRWLVIPAVVLFLSANLAAQGDAAKELKKFDGTWKIVALQKGGQVIGAGDLPEGMRLVFGGGKVTVVMPGPDGKDEKRVSAFKIDPTKKPKHCDVTHEDGNEKDKTLPGIYEWDGKRLKMCVNDGGNERPIAFASPEGSRVMFFTLERVPDKK